MTHALNTPDGADLSAAGRRILSSMLIDRDGLLAEWRSQGQQ